MKTELNRARWLVLAVFLFTTLQQAAAWYSPSQQRWINRDPVEEEGGVNLYTAFFNAPVNVFDLWGEAPIIFNGEVLDPDTINCLGYATDFGSYLGPAPGNSMKNLLESRGWKCKGPTKRKCKGKKGERVMVVYIYDTTGFPKGTDPWKSPWPNQGPDIHAIKQCPDDRWRYIPSICPANTRPIPSDGLKNPDSYFPPGKVPKNRYCCTR